MKYWELRVKGKCVLSQTVDKNLMVINYQDGTDTVTFFDGCREDILKAYQKLMRPVKGLSE